MSEPTSQQSLKILVAEDEPVNRVLMSKMLKHLGYQADYVGNGAEALSASNQKDYEIILMDIQMPEMDGFSATREILKSRPKETKPVIIAVTALAKDGIRDQCAQAGMSDYLRKPVDAEMLRQVLDKWKQPASSATGSSEMTDTNPDKALHERLDVLQHETDPSFVKELLDMFLASTPSQLEKIRQAIERSDGKVLHAGAHGLKGGSSNIGAARLASLCQKLENAGETGQFEDVNRLFDELNREFESLRNELRKYAAQL